MSNSKGEKTSKCPICGDTKREDHKKCYNCKCVEEVTVKGFNASQHEIEHAVRHAEDKPYILRKQFGLCPCDDPDFIYDDED